MTKQINK